MGRFINADAFASTGQGIIGNNMFAYCLNNPVMGNDPTGNWDWGWDDQAFFGTSIFFVGIIILLAAPTGGGSLAVGGMLLGSSTVCAAGTAMTVTGTVMVGDAIGKATVEYAKQSKKSGKEKANDTPSYVSRSDVDPNKSAKENAENIMNRQFGTGNWRTGPNSDYSKIKKWIERSFIYLVIEVLFGEEYQ